ncbi:MAG: DNA glycosylase [Oscillospiraceae bacterium]
MHESLKSEFVLATASELDLKKTFECGQCFRWSGDESGSYHGVACGKALTVREEDGRVLCSAAEADLPFWREYFDLGIDYKEMSRPFTEPPYLKKCADFGRGIRILRQEPWEALASFIISQCNNIPRIKKIISTLCVTFGEELPCGLFSFPSAEALAGLDEQDLAPLRCGYRAEYILCAARAVAGGELNLKAITDMSSEDAFAQVRSIRGIGDKVANCFMLYGLDRFPIDVWMKRALERHFPDNFDPRVLGPYAGLAQQYIFYYARTNECSDNLECS